MAGACGRADDQGLGSEGQSLPARPLSIALPGDQEVAGPWRRDPMLSLLARPRVGDDGNQQRRQEPVGHDAYRRRAAPASGARRTPCGCHCNAGSREITSQLQLAPVLLSPRSPARDTAARSRQERRNAGVARRAKSQLDEPG